MELYYYKECGFSQAVLNTIANLKIADQVELKNIRENPEYERELAILTGDTQVPCLVVDSKPMMESDIIRKYLVSRFL